jgi:glycosyltransferase involved in cell wall biosynthesis
MRIMFVCNEYPPAPHGGIGTFVQVAGRALVAAGHTVIVVGVRNDGASVRDDHGVRVVTLPGSPIPKLGLVLDRLALTRYVEAAARRGEIDIVEVPEFHGMLPFAVRGCPVVVRLHLSSTTMQEFANVRPLRLTGWFERRTLARHRNWIGVSRYALRLTNDSFPGHSAERQAVIYSPILPEEPIADPPPELPADFVLYAGLLSERKGALALASAAAIFLKKFPDVHLAYVGRASDTASRGDVLKLLGDRGGRCRFYGQLPRGQVAHMMRRARCFVFPSNLETFGLVVAEAMLNECPVVVSDSPPFDEFVEHEVTGLLVPPRDPGAIAAAVARLLGDPAGARAMGAAGRAAVMERFGIEHWMRETLAFYERCLGQRGRPAAVEACVGR